MCVAPQLLVSVSKEDVMKRLLIFVVGALLFGVMPASAAGGQETKTMTAKGTVAAVSGTSLTVKGGKEEWTFTLDEKTKVVGTGASTKTREKTGAGEKTVITDFVGEGDSVMVSYHETGGTKHASAVRVTRKASKK
jgi:hypothetical protein